MLYRRAPLTLALLSLLPLSCGKKEAPVAAPAALTPTDPDGVARNEAVHALVADMDPSADPCQDFYRYACGGWLDSTTRPADQASWTRSFSTIVETNRQIMRELLEQAAADPQAGGPAGVQVQDPAARGDWTRMGTLYGSCMDLPSIEAAGLAPVQPLLDAIDGIKGTADLPPVLGMLQADGLSPLFDLSVWGDLKDPDTTMAYAEQGGLGLPDRDYYLHDDQAGASLQQAYRAYVSDVLQRSGQSAQDAAANAEKIYAFELAIAKFSLPREQLRDPEKIYNPRDAAALAKAAPQLGWPALAQAAGLPLSYPLSLHDVGWFTALGKLLDKTDPATLRAYLRFHTLSELSEQLPDAWGQASFDFYGKQIYGQAQRKERWKRCVDESNGMLGDALGRAYVEEHFAGDSKEVARQMLHGIEGTFQTNLDGLAWMDDETRSRAKDKAQALVEKIGYPDKWLDTSPMDLKSQPYAANALAAQRFHVAHDLQKVGQPVDPTEWHMSAPTVNAYYNPTENEMVFPAGILQPPFFNHAFPSAMNYGGIGMVIGHELTHGFDDEGRKFDKDGKLSDWWQADTAKEFDGRAQCVADQYSGFTSVDGLHLNGQLTLGENLADLGGIKLAYEAWKAQGGGGPVPTVDNMTDDQLFFVSFAQDWCTLMSPELEKMLVTTNPHSPPRYRVNGPLENTLSFREAFQCQAGTPMVADHTCAVW